MSGLTWRRGDPGDWPGSPRPLREVWVAELEVPVRASDGRMASRVVRARVSRDGWLVSLAVVGGPIGRAEYAGNTVEAASLVALRLAHGQYSLLEEATSERDLFRGYSRPDAVDSDEETAAHDAEVAARHAAYHGEGGDDE